MNVTILQPAVVLAGWTLVVLLWLMARRFPAMKALGVDLGRLRGSRGSDLEGRVQAPVQWPAHNYQHLVEQPTLFYALVAVLAIAGDGSSLTLALAWGYALIRIVHSLWQITVNRVRQRLMLFVLSTLALAGLVARAAMAVF